MDERYKIKYAQILTLDQIRENLFRVIVKLELKKLENEGKTKNSD